jgi:tryptophan synthase alpha chain
MKAGTDLTEVIRQHRTKKDILLMTHIVLGYPNFEDSIRIVDAMAEAGVELIELQIPFSEPMADGPVILHANQKSLSAGSTVARCFEVARELATRHPTVSFLFMSYYNIVFKRGHTRFVEDTKAAGLVGAIIPDLPHEEGDALFSVMKSEGLHPIFLFSPNTKQERMVEIASLATGFVYCIARKGVTGAGTDFATLDEYLFRCREATDLPLALGFGVKDARDVASLVGKVDIAVVGSQTIKVIDEQGAGATYDFIRGLRAG